MLRWTGLRTSLAACHPDADQRSRDRRASCSWEVEAWNAAVSGLEEQTLLEYGIMDDQGRLVELRRDEGAGGELDSLTEYRWRSDHQPESRRTVADLDGAWDRETLFSYEDDLRVLEETTIGQGTTRTTCG